MTEQSTALRLADAIEPATIHAVAFCREAAGELRRQHEEIDQWRVAVTNAERERDIAGSQRDALLEALGKMVAVYSGQVQNDGGYTVLDSVRPLITDQAAIKAVED